MPSSGQNRCVVEFNPPQLAGSVICGQVHLAEAFRGLSSVKPIGVSLLPLTSHGRDANSSVRDWCIETSNLKMCWYVNSTMTEKDSGPY